MERESKVKGQSRETEDEKGKDKQSQKRPRCQPLSRFGVVVPGSPVLVFPDTRFGGQCEPGSVPELYVQ